MENSSREVHCSEREPVSWEHRHLPVVLPVWAQQSVRWQLDGQQTMACRWLVAACLPEEAQEENPMREPVSDEHQIPLSLPRTLFRQRPRSPHPLLSQSGLRLLFLPERPLRWPIVRREAHLLKLF